MAPKRNTDPAPARWVGSATNPGGIDLLRSLLTRHWSGETSHYPDWTADHPSYGQCAITALKVQDLLGGELLRIEIPGSGTHYANRIGSTIYDLTADQFPFPVDYATGGLRDREQVLSVKSTAARYAVFSAATDAELDAPLSVDDIEHVAIREPCDCLPRLQPREGGVGRRGGIMLLHRTGSSASHPSGSG